MVVVWEVGRVEALECHMVVADLGEAEVQEH
jgi:hypothetical protein